MLTQEVNTVGSNTCSFPHWFSCYLTKTRSSIVGFLSPGRLSKWAANELCSGLEKAKNGNIAVINLARLISSRNLSNSSIKDMDLSICDHVFWEYGFLYLYLAVLDWNLTKSTDWIFRDGTEFKALTWRAVGTALVMFLLPSLARWLKGNSNIFKKTLHS